MTNDQKLLYLINATDELIKAQERADQTGSTIFKEDARKKRNALKIWLAGNNIVITEQTPAVRKKTFNNSAYRSHQNYLAR